MQEAYYLHRGGYKCTIIVNALVTSHMTLHGYHFCCFNFQLRLAAPQRSLHPFRDRRLCFHDLLSLRGGGDDQRRRGKDKFGECQFLLFFMATHPAHCRQQQQNLNRKRSPTNGDLLQHWQWRRWNRVAPLHGRNVVASYAAAARSGGKGKCVKKPNGIAAWQPRKWRQTNSTASSFTIFKEHPAASPLKLEFDHLPQTHFRLL